MNATTDFILRKHSILDYLEKKGHLPFRQLPGGKYSYLCPFPDHNETKPSFMVFTGGKYQNFYCFGCQRNFNIINLVSEMEGISYQQAYAKLSDGVDISHLEERDHSLKEHVAECDIGSDNPIYNSIVDLEDALIDMSNSSRFYLESTDLQGEVILIDKFWEQIDKKIIDLDFNYVTESPQILLTSLELRKAKLDAEINQ